MPRATDGRSRRRRRRSPLAAAVEEGLSLGIEPSCVRAPVRARLFAGGRSVELNLLVVEDDRAQAELLCEHLSDRPKIFHITHVQRLSEALELVAEESFDAVVLDLGLPDSCGLSTLEALRRSEAQIPIVV